jgi:endonuclease/exonuclease/phosphatase family metal-dependent hydrolase
MTMRISLKALFFSYAVLLIGSFSQIAETRAESPQSRKEISIVTWNIEWYPGKRRHADEEEIAAHKDSVKSALCAIDPDILLAQEIRDWQAFAELCDAVPGLRPIVVSAFRAEDTGEYWPQQVGIASKLPAMAGWSEFWRVGPVHPRRGFGVIVVPINENQLMLVYNLHLKSNRAADENEAMRNVAMRDESIRQLLDHISEMENIFLPGRIAAVIIGGDFNTNQDRQFGDRVHESLTQAGFVNAWHDTPRKGRLTWRGHESFEPTTLDHIYVRGLPSPRAELITVPDNTSDHWPVRIRLPWPADPKP